MIKIEKKNKWAIDLSLHIPLPSISFEIKRVETESETQLNTPLHRYTNQTSYSSKDGLHHQMSLQKKQPDGKTSSTSSAAPDDVQAEAEVCQEEVQTSETDGQGD